MRRIVALLGCVGLLVAAAPAQAGVLKVSSDGTAYHFVYTTGKHRATRIHVGGDVTWTAFMDTSRMLHFTDSTGQCIRTSLYRVQCPFQVSTVTAHLSLGADVYAASVCPGWRQPCTGSVAPTPSTGGWETTCSTAAAAMITSTAATAPIRCSVGSGMTRACTAPRRPVRSPDELTLVGGQRVPTSDWLDAQRCNFGFPLLDGTACRSRLTCRRFVRRRRHESNLRP